MATKTIINCMDNSVISPSHQGISIIIDQPTDNFKQSSSLPQSPNIIKIQHASDQSSSSTHQLLVMSSSTTLNNKTLIDINRNNDNDEDEDNDDDDDDINDHLHNNIADQSKDHVLQINCTTSNEISREIKENSNTLTQLEYKSRAEMIITNGQDHNEEEKLDLRKDEKEIVKQEEEDNKEFTKYQQQHNKHKHSPEDEEESGQTTTSQNNEATQHQHQQQQQQVNNDGNSKCRENGHFTQNYSTTTKLEHNNDHHNSNSNDHDNDQHHNDHDHDHDVYEKDHNNEVTSIGEDISGKRVNADFSHGKRPFNEENSNSLITKADAFATTTLTINQQSSTNNYNNNNQNKIQKNFKDLDTTLKGDLENHVVKIQIKPNNLQTERKQITVVKIENLEKPLEIEKKFEIKEENLENSVKKEQAQESVLINEKMVQKPSNNNLNTVTVSNNTISSSTTNGNGNGNGNATVSNTGSTTVTEINVSSSNYLYYMMSSGQFSPCDTLDSGTGSDLESNGQQQQSSPSLLTKMSANTCLAPLEMHIKTTKIRVSNTTKSKDLQQRQCSFTDSEESEASSLSCDSLHSNEFLRQQSTSPIATKAGNKKIQTLLPDSLLREIKNLKFSSNDYEAENEEEDDIMPQLKNSHNLLNKTNDFEADNNYETINTQDYVNSQSEYMQARNNLKNHSSSLSSSLKRASLPSKTFVLNAEDGTFIDTKLNSIPRKYEADKYYNFHVHEHDNFRSFGNNNSSSSTNGDGDSLSISDYDTKSLQDDVFAGYRDIRCGSNTSTIRSSKGTVRGVKNRVRNGIATFLQLQEPNVKNFKEKDSGKVVLYTTSMGIIRDTYAKCSNVKQILRTLLVKFEERDVFMSVEYQQEIKERMHSDIIKVPQLYVEGQHIGDADTVERLNESGELRQLLKPYKSISTTYTCQTCGGYRLLPCPSCNGSKKSVHRNHFTAEFVALKCMNCDEVGLVKCHNC